MAVLLASPVQMLISEPASWSPLEKRMLAAAPALPGDLTGWPAFFPALDAYLQDHFGFREHYIYRYNRELAKRFAITNPNVPVLKGVDGWYFYTAFNMLDDFWGKIPLRDEQLRQWLTEQQKKNDWLASHGIRYLLLVPPNKQSMYPHFVGKDALASKGISRYEQLLAITGGILPPYMLDLHSLLRPDQYNKPLYYKNDSHWNDFAALLVVQQIVARLSQWFPQESFRSDFPLLEQVTGPGGNSKKGGDLAMMLMQRRLTETYPQLAPFPRCGKSYGMPYQFSNLRQSHGRPSYVWRCTRKKLRAVIFRDSFLTPLVPMLSGNFQETVYLWKEYDQKNIEEILTRYQADVVIEEIVERHMFDSITR